MPNADDADKEGFVSEDSDNVPDIDENDVMLILENRDALEDLESNDESIAELAEEDPQYDGIFFTAKNGLEWSSEPIFAGQHQANIIHEHCDPKLGIHPQTEKEAFLRALPRRSTKLSDIQI